MNKINTEEVINKWFEMKFSFYNKLEDDESIYLYYEGENYTDIRINKKIKCIYIKWAIYNELSDIISLEYLEFVNFMTEWVEYTFGLEGLTSVVIVGEPFSKLKIPK